MLDIKFVRNNPDVVKQNIKNKFQDEKLPLVDEVIELDKRNREIKQEVEALRAEKNKASKEIGAMMAQKKIGEAEALKKKVAESNGRINELSEEEKEAAKKDMEQMLDYIDTLNELDTAGIEPMSHVFPVQNVFREDVVTNGDNKEATLANAPLRKEDSFEVPKTIG